jgi:hypothetical protein
MDVSLRHWPIFATGLLLGAAGTMSLGLHRPTQAELAAAASANTTHAVAMPAASAAAAAAAAPVAQIAPPVAENPDEKMQVAAESFRTQEAVAAAAMPYAVAAALPKPKARRVVKDAEVPALASAPDAAPTIAIAPETAPEPVTRLRSSTSVMGAAPARRAEMVDAVERIEPARGSAHSPDVGEARSSSE